MADVTTEGVMNTTTTSSNVVLSPRHDMALKLRIIVLPFIISVGTVGNALSFLVLIRRRMRTNSIYNYLLILSLVDTVILYFSALKTWVKEISGFELLHVSWVACKLLSFLVLVAWYASSWLIVLMTVDRFIAVWFPLKASHMCTVTRARIACGVMLLLAVAANIHIFWTFNLFYSEERKRFYCYGDQAMKFMSGQHFERLKLASYCFLPFIVVLCLNCAIIHRLRIAQKTMSNDTNSVASVMTSQPRNHGVHRKITYMLLTVSFSWFVMTAPFSLQIFMGTAYNDVMYKTLIFLLMYTNHSVNFFLYCITGRKFRYEVRRLFRSDRSTCAEFKNESARKFNSKTRISDQTDESSGEKLPLKTTVSLMKNNFRDKAAADV